MMCIKICNNVYINKVYIVNNIVCSALELNDVSYNLYVEVSNLKYYPPYVHRKV